MSPGERDALAVGSARVLSEILEAVRALAPTPTTGTTEDSQEVVMLRDLTEAVRALKPAPFAQPIEKVYRMALEENGKLHDRVMRSEAEVERLRAELDAARTAENIAHRVVEVQEAELKRFREREAKYVEPLMRMVGRQITRLPDSAMELFKAVRDFKVTP